MQSFLLTLEDIEAFFNELGSSGLSASSIVKALDVLNSAYDWALKRGHINANPFLPVKDTIKRRILKLNDKEADDADVLVPRFNHN